MISPGGNELLVEEFMTAWDAMDPEAVSSLFVARDDPYLEEEATGAEIRAYGEETSEVVPDFRFEWHRAPATPEGVAVTEWTVRGTHRGAFGGIPPTGKTVSVPGVSVISFSEEGTTAQRDYWDRRTSLDRLGLTFPATVVQLPTLV